MTIPKTIKWRTAYSPPKSSKEQRISPTSLTVNMNPLARLTLWPWKLGHGSPCPASAPLHLVMKMNPAARYPGKSVSFVFRPSCCPRFIQWPRGPCSTESSWRRPLFGVPLQTRSGKTWSTVATSGKGCPNLLFSCLPLVFRPIWGFRRNVP